ncbi:MAG: DoxX family protein [Byssovorax sp.]
MSTASEPSKGKVIATWILSGLVALAMIGAGAMKLPGKMADEFIRLGFPGWFSYVAGVIEVAAGVLILIPKVAVVGAALTICTMVVAAGALIRVGEPNHIAPALIIGVMAAVVAFLRKDAFLKLIGR